MRRAFFLPFGSAARWAAFLVLTSTWPAAAQSNEFRALWVDAWGTGFLDASQVTHLVADARAYNFNALIVQMRRRGDAFYNHTYNDPKTTAIASGFDALQDILTKAHDTTGGKPRLQVHCWVTTFLIWSSANPPSQPGHVFNLHPEYLTRNSAGTNYISEGYYLDPGHPDATWWNYQMATNIVRRYAVDGFHWDYIRYPTTDSGYNPTALARYNAEFGLTGQPSPSDPQFSNWRRRQVTDFLRWVNAELLSLRSNLVISCAVFGSRSDAYNARFQDWAAWNAEGILDICMPMGYTADNALFTSRVDDAFHHQGVRRVYHGQGAYLNTKENTVWQLAYLRNKPLLGSVLYSYRTPNSGTPNIPVTLGYVRDQHQPTWVDVPGIPWKTSPTHGILRGTVTRQSNGSAVYNATVTLSPAPARTQKTEAHGAFAFFETPPATYTLTVTAADLAPVSTNVALAAGQNLALRLALGPDNTPPLIANVAATNLTDTSATIVWTTDENANSAVDYGPTVSYGTVASNAVLTLNHALTLTNLAPNTLYHYRVRSRNAANLQTNSADLTFRTNPAGVVSDIIIDDAAPAATTAGSWTISSTSPGYYGSGYRYNGMGTGTEHVTFRPTFLVPGQYKVYVWYVQGSNRTTDAPHIVKTNGGSVTISVNQQTNGYVRVTDGFTTGNVVMADAVKFAYVQPPVPPTITNQPQGKTVNLGANAPFLVGATGTTPLSYQWRFEGTNLAGATASSYTRTNAQPAHEGDYSVVVTNVAGAVTSNPAFLLVNIPPRIVSPPQSQVVLRGREAPFTVLAEGSAPLSYQWWLDGTTIPGATASSYTRTNAQPGDAGNYWVVVTNMAGRATSAVATLTVRPPRAPEFLFIGLQPDSRLRLVVAGEAGISCVLEQSDNLREWTAVATNLNSEGTVEFWDGAPVLAPSRFYRVRL